MSEKKIPVRLVVCLDNLTPREISKLKKLGLYEVTVEIRASSLDVDVGDIREIAEGKTSREINFTVINLHDGKKLSSASEALYHKVLESNAVKSLKRERFGWTRGFVEYVYPKIDVDAFVSNRNAERVEHARKRVKDAEAQVVLAMDSLNARIAFQKKWLKYLKGKSK